MDTSAFTQEKFALYKKYQMKVHGDKEPKLKEDSFTQFLCTSPLRVRPTTSNLRHPLLTELLVQTLRWRNRRWRLSRMEVSTRCTA